MFEEELQELLQRPGARFVAFDPTGSVNLPVPDSLEVETTRSDFNASPLDTVDPSSHVTAIVAFERARRHGRATVTLKLVGEDSPYRLELFNAEATHGCFLGSMFPTDAEPETTATATTDLPPRRAVYHVSTTGQIMEVSPEFTAMLGHTFEQVEGLSSLEFIHPDDHEAAIVAWIEMLEKPGVPSRALRRYKRTQGDWLWCESTNTNRLDDPDNPVVVAELVDVSREMAAQAALQRRETLLDRLSRALPTGVLFVDADGTTAFSNERWTELTGLDADENLDALLDRIEEGAMVQEALARACREGVDVDLEVTFRSGADSGRCRYGALHLRPLRENHVQFGLLATLDDQTSTRTFQNQLAEQSRRDPLTQVLNRLGLEEVLMDRLADRRRGKGEVAVLFIDLDEFKIINDTHGHSVGDRVLRLASERIGSMIRSTDALGRIGGDEFVVVLGGETSPEHAARLADRIQAAIPLIGDQFDVEVAIGGTVGAAFARDGDDFDSILRRADHAMYEGKRRSTSRSAFDDGGEVLGEIRPPHDDSA